MPIYGQSLYNLLRKQKFSDLETRHGPLETQCFSKLILHDDPGLTMTYFTASLGAPIAQFGERRPLDPKVAGTILNWGAVLCPRARHLILIA